MESLAILFCPSRDPTFWVSEFKSPRACDESYSVVSKVLVFVLVCQTWMRPPFVILAPKSMIHFRPMKAKALKLCPAAVCATLQTPAKNCVHLSPLLSSVENSAKPPSFP